MLRLLWILILLLPVGRNLAKALQTHRGFDPNSWAMTEWMINNSAGFVRRGLGGSILLGLHRLSPVPFLGEFGLLLALITIGATTALILRACLRVGRFDALMIMYSPLIYPSFLNYAVETVFRKDALVVLFVVLALLAQHLAARRQALLLVILAVLLLPLLTLVHEMVPFFCLAPLLLIALPLLLRRWSSPFAVLAALFALCLPTLLTMLLIRLNSHPNMAMVEQMCMAWQQHYPSLACTPVRISSAFPTLADYDISQRTLNWIHSEPVVRRFRLEGLLAIAYVLAMAIGPLGRLAALQASRNRIQGAWLSLLSAAVVFVPTLPMYWLATDFGRWLGMAMTIFTLMICSRVHVRALAASLDQLDWLRLPLSLPADRLRSLYANLNGFILLINVCLIPQAYSVLLWTYSPQLRILLRPFGL